MTTDTPTPQYTWMCWPTLDICFDIHADTEEEAMEKLRELTQDIIRDCYQKLEKLGGKAGNADFNYCTDCDPYIGDGNDN